MSGYAAEEAIRRAKQPGRWDEDRTNWRARAEAAEAKLAAVRAACEELADQFAARKVLRILDGP